MVINLIACEIIIYSKISPSTYVGVKEGNPSSYKFVGMRACKHNGGSSFLGDRRESSGKMCS